MAGGATRKAIGVGVRGGRLLEIKWWKMEGEKER